eukprot:6475827-Amphidinium_carterae.1
MRHWGVAEDSGFWAVTLSANSSNDQNVVAYIDQEESESTHDCMTDGDLALCKDGQNGVGMVLAAATSQHPRAGAIAITPQLMWPNKLSALKLCWLV